MSWFNVFSRKDKAVSFHITEWEDIDTTSAVTFFRKTGNEFQPFYMNNLTDESILTTGKHSGMTHRQTVKLLPGWNEYLLTEIVLPASAGTTVQWGE